MVTVNTFRGLRFDPTVVGDPGRVIAPPYDVISPEARVELEARSPYNMVRLILAQGDYAEVGKLIADWTGQGAMVVDDTPCLYAYEETYEVGGERRAQRGVLASVPLDPSRTWILPHERTMDGPVADRLALLRATGGDLSPVFGLYGGQGRATGILDRMTAGEPDLDGTDDTGIRHRLWVVRDPELITEWRGAIADRQLLIADGHHRYRTSLQHAASTRATDPDRDPGPEDEVLMFVADADAGGPTVLPIHRLLPKHTAAEVLAAASGGFTARRVDLPVGTVADDPAAAVDALAAALDEAPADVPAYGLLGGDGAWLLTADDPAALAAEAGLDRAPLDVEALHLALLGPRLGIVGVKGAAGDEVVFEADRHRAATLLARGDHQALLLLRPTPFDAVLRVAQGGEVLPPKTTFFYPKPRDGMVLRPFDPDALAAGR